MEVDVESGQNSESCTDVDSYTGRGLVGVATEDALLISNHGDDQHGQDSKILGAVSGTSYVPPDEGTDDVCLRNTMETTGMDVELTSANNLSAICKAMLDRVSCSDAHFKNQQRGDPDLTQMEKLEIATEILNKNPATFLYRFSKHLTPRDLEYFSSMEDSYEVNFYLKDIRHQQNVSHSKNQVKNRRYEAMKQLMMQGEYFSEDEMKWRDPYLYEQMIGQHLTDEDIAEKVDKADLRFSTILIKHMDQLQENDLYARSKDKEEGQEEEEESDEDEEEGDSEEMEDEVGETKGKAVSDHEKQELKDEFLQIMQERFLEGQDKDFDYSQVDGNAEYDDMNLLDKDEEEKYFNAEDPEIVADDMATSMQISSHDRNTSTIYTNGSDGNPNEYQIHNKQNISQDDQVTGQSTILAEKVS